MLFVSDYGTTWTRTLFVPPCERSFPENEMVRNYLLARYLTSGQFECTQGAGAVWFLCVGDNNSTRIKRVQSWYVLLLKSCCIYIAMPIIERVYCLVSFIVLIIVFPLLKYSPVRWSNWYKWHLPQTWVKGDPLNTYNDSVQ